MAQVINLAEVRAVKRPAPVAPVQTATVPAPAPVGPGMHGYYPEMGDKKPACQIEARLSHGGKWWVKTPLQLKGRGITFIQTYTAKDLVPAAQHKVGWHVYELTRLAFDTLKQRYSISVEILLD